MSKEIKITKERVKKYYDKSTCEEVKAFLHEFFPEAFEEKWVEIGEKTEVRLMRFGKGRYAMQFRYKSNSIGYMWAGGKIECENNYKIEKDNSGGEYCLKFFKKSGK